MTERGTGHRTRHLNRPKRVESSAHGVLCVEQGCQDVRLEMAPFLALPRADPAAAQLSGGETLGGVCLARSDIFGFGVSLFEAIASQAAARKESIVVGVVGRPSVITVGTTWQSDG